MSIDRLRQLSGIAVKKQLSESATDTAWSDHNELDKAVNDIGAFVHVDVSSNVLSEEHSTDEFYIQSKDRLEQLLGNYVEPEDALNIVQRELLSHGLDMDHVDQIMNDLHSGLFQDNQMGELDGIPADNEEAFEFDESITSKWVTLDELAHYIPEHLFEDWRELLDNMPSTTLRRNASITNEWLIKHNIPVNVLAVAPGDDDEFVYEIQETGVEEAFDIQNGYKDVHDTDGSDYFPNGADGPVVKSVGPSGARHGDNPEQKKMQVDEIHKTLVYGYRQHLKESSIRR